VGWAFLIGFLLLVTLWAIAALAIDVPVPWLGRILAVLYVAAVLTLWLVSRRRILNVLCTIGAFALVLAWWLLIPPSNQRDWQPDVAVLPYSETTGSQITVHNIRNCDYRSETDYDVHYYDKTYDLDKLRSVDLYLVNWGAPSIAHTMVSFGFEDGSFLCISIETRKEKGESYSALKGFFRQFELIYVVADERDLVRLRTNYRKGEEVFLYRINASPAGARALFLSYLKRVNQLHSYPEWYNALTSNCTTNIRVQADQAGGRRTPWDLRILLNGKIDELLYERSRISTRLPFAELKQRCHINERARRADKDPAFSELIRRD
jgi:hypothetical protein